MTGPSQPEKQTVRDYLDLWNGDHSKIDVVSESGVVHDSDAPDGEVHGRDGIEAFVRGFRDGNPDAHFDVQELVLDDGLALFEWTLTGTGDEESRGMSKVVIEDGEVTQDWIYHDR